MKNKKFVLIAGLLVALLVVMVIGATSAYAQNLSNGPQQGPGPGGRGPRDGALGGPGLDAAAKALGMTTDELSAALKEGKTLEQLATDKGVDFATVQAAMQTAMQAAHKDDRGVMRGPASEAAAKALGMTTDELSAALKEGKTLEQLAQDKGVDFATVQSAMQTERDTQMRERIQQSLTDGKITQENADWLLEGLEKGFLNGPGGFGFGFDGPHGPGSAPAEGAPPTQASGQ